MTGASGNGVGTGGSSWNGDTLSYPAVPYSSADFNHETCPNADGNIHNYDSPDEVRGHFVPVCAMCVVSVCRVCCICVRKRGSG